MIHFYSQIFNNAQIGFAKRNILQATYILVEGIDYYIKTMKSKQLKVQCSTIEQINNIKYSPGKFFKKNNNSTIIIKLREQEFNITPKLKEKPTDKIYLFDDRGNKVIFNAGSYEILSDNLIFLKENYDNKYIKANIEGEDYSIFRLFGEIKKDDNIIHADKQYTILEVEKIKDDLFQLVINGIIQNKDDIYFNDINITSIIEDISTETSTYKEITKDICYHKFLPKGAKELKYKDLLQIKEIKEKFEEKKYNLDGYNKEDYKLEPLYITIAGEKIKFEFETKRYVQLELLDNQNEATIDYLDILFNDKFRLKDDKNKYDVEIIDKEEKVVTLKENNKECFIEKDKIMSIEIDVANYKRQKDALQLIRYTPYKHLRNLLKLFENKEKVSFDSFDISDDNIDCKVIELDKEGAIEQIDFVKKAMNTPDFAFLSGPPGSGKTTVILELICQLIKDNKRVLLCGSTHVAIDNVLERLDEKGLIEEFNIIPLRIGKTERISEKLEKYSYPEMVKSYEDKGMDKEFLHYASNLVCGTTMGILSYEPLQNFFRNRNNIKDDLLFDYLIIDESSKTTFQEFLVPAVFAKKWILVGDIHQLSPYVEQDFIEKVLDNAGSAIEEKILVNINNYLKQACVYLEYAKQFITKKEHFKIAVLVCENVINELYLEYNARIKNINNREDGNYKKIYIINSKNVDIISLFNADVLFFTEKYYDFIPPHYLIIAEKEKKADLNIISHEYKNKAYHGKEYSILNDKREETDILDRNWAKEIAWRIERCNQLRIFDNDTGNTQNKRLESYKKHIDNLMPIEQKDKVIDLIDEYASILLPSILELLEKGAVIKRAKKDFIISRGFDEDIFKKRNSILSYQHRMHEDISAFPRENFYNGEALKDAKIDREWNYKRYSKRIVWLDVESKDNKGKNYEEINVVHEELDEFIKFAQKNKKSDGSKWSVGILSFYLGQIKSIREVLQNKFKTKSQSRFVKDNVEIKLSTVDRFQGDEKDIIFLSMVRTDRDGFLDSPYRLNVAITRARYQLVVIGKRSYFKDQSKTPLLNKFAKQGYGHKERFYK